MMFTNDEKKFLGKLKFNKFGNLNIDDIFELEDIVSKFLQAEGFDENYNLTKDGKLAECILDKVSEL